jgi:copper chaperone CopZ
MKRTKTMAVLSAVALLAAATAWAGGAGCSTNGGENAAAKTCPVSGAHASMASAMGAGGAHCEGFDKSNAEAMAKACTIGKNQAIYSFAVPGAECDGCANSIKSTLMQEKGIHCAHVDLENHVAYVIADKKMSTKKLSSLIQTAGFKNKYRGEGAKIRTEFAKAMSASSGENGMSCCAKQKDKV